MLLTLMRHGKAEDWADTDAQRALTTGGSAMVSEVVRGLRAGGWSPGAIIASPLVRAQQTARLVAEQFPGVATDTLREVLEPEDGLLEALARRELVDPLVVGHEPGLSRLAGRLIGARGLLAFDTASVACFRVDGLPPRKPAELLFFAPPSFVRCLRQ